MYSAIVEKTNTGFSAYIDGLSVFTTGSTMKDLKSNMIEALELHFEEERTSIHEDEINFKLQDES